MQLQEILLKSTKRDQQEQVLIKADTRQEMTRQVEIRMELSEIGR